MSSETEKTIAVVKEIYGKIEALSPIITTLTSAQEKLASLGDMLSEGNTNYQGKALTEMYTYYAVMTSHVSKLAQLYALAQSSALASIEEIIKADEELSRLIAQTGEGGAAS